MTTESTDSRPGVLYRLSNEAQDLTIRTVVAADGSIASLSYQEGDAEPRVFSGAEITTPAAGAGTSMAAVSVSRVIRGASAATLSPGFTCTSMISTSLKSPRLGTFTSSSAMGP